MIAYNRLSLDNREVRLEAEEAFARGVISSAEYERIREAYPVKLYIPNGFIRIGFFLLTVMAVACGLGLLLLMNLGAAGERGIGFITIFWGVVSFAALEFFIHSRGVFRAGVDDALLWSGVGLIYGGINLSAEHITPVVDSYVLLLLATWGLVRYADRLMGLVAYGALLGVLYFGFTAGGGGLGAMILPFVIMGVSVAGYFGFTRFAVILRLRHYNACLVVLRVGALLSFYTAGNYYVVRSVQESMGGGAPGGGALSGGSAVALGWLWWAFTFVVPIGYVVWGVRRKDAILLLTGMGLVAVAIFTVRYYYHLLPVELAMILGGVVLIVGAYGLIRYLRVPRDGITSAASDEPHLLADLGVEGLVVAETFRGVGGGGALDKGADFGGGSGGGGGASGGW